MSLYGFEDSFFGLMPCGTFSYSWHFSFPLIIFYFSGLLAAAEWLGTQAEKQARSTDYFLSIICLFSRYLLTEFNSGCFSHSTCHISRAAHSSATFGIFTAHKMTATGTLVTDLACSGNLDSFAQSLMGFLFRHLVKSLKTTRNPAPKSRLTVNLSSAIKT
jgi:hypothetical protein